MNYIGNVFHLLQPDFCEDVSEIQGTNDCNDTTSIQPSADTLVKQTEIFLKESEKWFVGIRNSDLDGFMDAFANEKIVCCGNCIKCGYCDIFAKKIVINPVWQQKMIRLMNYNLGRYYG